MNDEIRRTVQKTYAELARTGVPCCSPANSLYPLDLLQGLPPEIAEFTAGNGDPVTPARLQRGETVLDLGSGGGLDCFLAARQVGKAGHVIGVDMTAEMIERAKSAAERLGLENVEFRLGYLEALPVEDNRVDVILSNCVINLSPDKPAVFREMFRVLKPGGRISISDTVASRPVTEEQRQNMADWCGCTSGALSYDEYIAELQKAGFVDIQLRPALAAAQPTPESEPAQPSALIPIEQVLSDAVDLQQCSSNSFLPYLITARKPA